MLAAALLWLTGLQAVAEPLSPPAFRDRLAAALSGLSQASTVPIDDRTFRTNRPNGEELTVNIDSAYAQYRADPSQLEAILARYARIMVTAPDDQAPADRLG